MLQVEPARWTVYMGSHEVRFEASGEPSGGCAGRDGAGFRLPKRGVRNSRRTGESARGGKEDGAENARTMPRRLEEEEPAGLHRQINTRYFAGWEMRVSHQPSGFAYYHDSSPLENEF